MLLRRFYILLVLISTTASAQYIITDESRTSLQLVENVLINSGCASVSNASVSGGNFATSEKSFGYFNANGSGFPFSDGLILSTGKIINARGPNNFISDDTAVDWLGDSDLNQALNLSNTFNATTLEFDFVPLGNQISFDYIFSSEQYLTNPTPGQCSFTDGFAFLLKEANGSNYTNLAVIPNTNIPVKVNTVRGPGTICPAANASYFDAFNGIEHPTNYNGQTKVLTAKATVTPGLTYHIKLVIADEGNYRYDSAIFLKGSSFNVGVNLGPDRTLAGQNPICFDENITVDGTSSGAQSYQWSFNGNPIAGQVSGTLNFSPPYTSSQNGTYSLSTTYSTSCTTFSEIDLDFSPQIGISQTSYSFCDNLGAEDGIGTISLSDIITTLFINLPTNYQVVFYKSPTNTAILPTTFHNTTPFQQIIYARILNNSCYTDIPVTINVLVFTDTILDESVIICNNTQVTLTADTGFQSYLWNTGQITPSIQIASPNTYSVTIKNSDGCTKIKTFVAVGSEIATINNIIVNDFSNTNSAEIITSGNGNYEYSIDGFNYQNTPFFTNLNALAYTAFVRDKNGCGITAKEFYLLQIPKYFTPNGDGFNETWNIRNLTQRNYNRSIITIFDRYGKLLKQFSGSSTGWDGTYNGKTLPADDYWFTFTHDGKELLRGHLTLKR
jgi:gliding motility-associated-like protein